MHQRISASLHPGFAYLAMTGCERIVRKDLSGRAVFDTGVGPVNTSALRVIAGVGLLAAGLLVGGPAVVPVLAQTGDATDSGGGSDGDSPPGYGVESAPRIDGDGAPDGSGHPTSTIGDGRNDVVDPTATGEGASGVRVGETRPSPKFDPLLIPF